LPGFGVDGARTLALVSWIVGHAVLGIVMGWERQPVALLALLRNWAMLAWAAGAAAFALLLIAVPPFASLLHAGHVPLPAAVLALGAAVVAPLWLEVAKRGRRGEGRGRPPAAPLCLSWEPGAGRAARPRCTGFSGRIRRTKQAADQMGDLLLAVIAIK